MNVKRLREPYVKARNAIRLRMDLLDRVDKALCRINADRGTQLDHVLMDEVEGRGMIYK